jgi:hypothetical protein
MQFAACACTKRERREQRVAAVLESETSCGAGDQFAGDDFAKVVSST